jgi:thioredoxin reductase
MRQYDRSMTTEREDDDFTRRMWLQASAALGVALATGCAPQAAAPVPATSVKGTSAPYDVAVVGGGPAGLAAALTLGRARKRVLLCDGGPRRNAAAERIHNFVTRDGTPPDAFRRAGREQLAIYPNVEVRDARVESVTGSKGAFRAVVDGKSVDARRLLLCTGMSDEPLPIEGFADLLGHAIFQCPYCHGWEVKDRPWGYLARAEHASHVLPFSLLLRGWTRDVVVFTSGELELPPETRFQLEAGGVRLETARVARLVARDQRLEAVELADGRRVRCEALFARPPQRQTDLVRTLGLALDDAGFVRVDAATRETSMPGVYASGDLTTSAQAAIAAAAAGAQTAGALNRELTAELVSKGFV